MDTRTFFAVCGLGMVALVLVMPGLCAAAQQVAVQLDLTDTAIGYAAIGIFVVAYALVMVEEFTHLRKSKPVILAAGIIWLLVSVAYPGDDPHAVAQALRHNLLEYAELMLFLLVAMTYINALEERLVFESLRSWLVRKRLTYRQLFWMTGILSFFISPVADNLTTALLMCAVVLAVGGASARFVSLACINIVVAANAGGAFSPFGDITTLMVWQKGIVDFSTFFLLFIPSVVNFIVPAGLMHAAVPRFLPDSSGDAVVMKRGAGVIMLLFLLTIGTAVIFHSFFHLPPMMGMMTGLAYLQIFGYYLKKTHHQYADPETWSEQKDRETIGDVVAFDVFRNIARAEWDTLLFFYGVVMCVGGLGFLGYLAVVSQVMYLQWGPTFANIMVGILSAIVDNIPVMFAVLTMHPDMSQGQWLLVTLTAGVGGSLLSVGSAAGVALMGRAQGKYTFFGHLKWAPAIALGYAASILVHLWINAAMF